MNISVTSLVTEPQYFTKAHLQYLESVGAELQYPAKEASGRRWSQEPHKPGADYQHQVSRIIHYFASQELAQQVGESQYSVDSLKAYFKRKIEVQNNLNRCTLIPDDESRLRVLDCLRGFLDEYAWKAGNVYYTNQTLTKRIIQYVNQQEAEYFSLLPQRDQYQFFYSICCNNISIFVRSPVSLVIALFVAIPFLIYIDVWLISRKGF